MTKVYKCSDCHIWVTPTEACLCDEEEEQFVYDLNGKPIQTIKDFKNEFCELLEEEEENNK